MNYLAAETYPDEIVCYWESHEMGEESEYTYPSLPEPYISIYFSLDPNCNSLIKGITWQPDYLRMKSQLFGVTLKLSGFLQLGISRSEHLSNRIIPLKEIAGHDENTLLAKMTLAKTFEERVSVFNAYYQGKKQTQLTDHQSNIAGAYAYLLDAYKDPNVINNYALKKSLATRTINRWFNNDIGISPKRLSRVIRFHRSLFALHAYKEEGFYLDYGYFDQAHFIREFKEFTGKSPERYLKMVSDLYNWD